MLVAVAIFHDVVDTLDSLIEYGHLEEGTYMIYTKRDSGHRRTDNIETRALAAC
jgi:hypothetical protein